MVGWFTFFDNQTSYQALRTPKNRIAPPYFYVTTIEINFVKKIFILGRQLMSDGCSYDYFKTIPFFWDFN